VVSDIGGYHDRSVMAQYAIPPAFDVTRVCPEVKHALLDAHLPIL